MERKKPSDNPTIKEKGKVVLGEIPEYITVDMLELGIQVGISSYGEVSRMRDLLVRIVYDATMLPEPANLNGMQAILDIVNHLDENENLSPRSLAEAIISVRDQVMKTV